MSERAGFLRSPLVRLTAYYIVLGLAAWGLAILYPPIIDSASGERLGELAQRGLVVRRSHTGQCLHLREAELTAGHRRRR